MPMEPDCIEKQTEIAAPVSRVWRALTDHSEFSAWFGVKLDGPFKAGEESHGQVTNPGYEHVTWRAVIQQIDPEQYFAFTWHPYAVKPDFNYSREVPTLVEFRLQASAKGGTLLDLSECGFNDLPDERRKEAYAANEGGWAEQLKNIAEYVAKTP
jgi:uncharacterized protein YndB with AHSA1/START domain